MRSTLALTLAATLLGAAAAPQTVAPLQTFWSDARADYWVVATQGGLHAAAEVFKYKRVRTEGMILTAQQPGTRPLELYWNEKLSDNRNIASPESKKEALADGYELKATEGYVYATRQPGTVPLKLFWNAARSDSYTGATAEGERAALADGYRFVRIEGYIQPADATAPGTTAP